MTPKSPAFEVTYIPVKLAYNRLRYVRTCWNPSYNCGTDSNPVDQHACVCVCVYVYVCVCVCVCVACTHGNRKSDLADYVIDAYKCHGCT